VVWPNSAPDQKDVGSWGGGIPGPLGWEIPEGIMFLSGRLGGHLRRGDSSHAPCSPPVGQRPGSAKQSAHRGGSPRPPPR